MVDLQVERKALSRIMRSYGLGDSQATKILHEFSKNNGVISEDSLVLRLSDLGLTIYEITAVCRKLGLSGENAIRILEHEERKKFGAMSDELEVIL